MEPTVTSVKTLGVKLPDELHAQFSLVAALDQISLNEAVQRAVAHWVTTKQQEPGFADRAKAVLEEIEREAAAKRDAIQALFGQQTVASVSTTVDDTKAAKAKRGSESASA